MELRRVGPVAGVAVLALAVAAAAQSPPQGGVRNPRMNRPGAAAQQAGQPAGQAAMPQAGRPAAGGTARYLADHPQVLDLTPVEQARIRKLAAHEDSANAPLRAQMQQLTGGRPIRELPPAERRRLAPQLRDVMQQMHANDAAELDSVAAILTPEQANRLETLREDFKQRQEARRSTLQTRIDSARARAGQRPPRP